MSRVYTIRQVRPEDKAAWHELWKNYQTFYEVEIVDDVTEQTWKRLLEHDSFGCFVAVDNTDLTVAMTTFTLHGHTWELSPCCYLVDLFVADDHRRAGLARMLIDRVVEAAKAQDWPRVYWLTKEDNHQARKLYDQYAPVSEFVRYNIALGN